MVLPRPIPFGGYTHEQIVNDSREREALAAARGRWKQEVPIRKHVVKQVVKQVAPSKNYTEETLRFAAKGITKKQGGLNKGDVKLAVLEVYKDLRVQHEAFMGTTAASLSLISVVELLSLVNDKSGDVLREMLKELLGYSSPMGKLPCILPDPPKYLLYALGSVSEHDQQTIVDRAPHTMVYHDSVMAPLSVAGMSIQEIEQNFVPIKYFAAGHTGHEHIGL
jgi:hypothetical protein